MSAVLCALSGGVDSTVAAARLLDDGHEVVAITMLLWGGPRQSRSCSTADADAAAAAAAALDVRHLVVDWTDHFDRAVVGRFVAGAAAGRTPNPCITCNATFKVDALFAYARAHGFDKVATGHHARVLDGPDGRPVLGRSVDRAKDQSYVIHMLGHDALSRLVLPLGDLTKDQVRSIAAQRHLPAADVADSMDLCFSRPDVLRAAGIDTTGVVVDAAGTVLGTTDSFALVTIGQRRGLPVSGGAERRYVTAIDPSTATVTVGSHADTLSRSAELVGVTVPVTGRRRVQVQLSAHAPSVAGTVVGNGATRATVLFDAATRRPAPGQSVVCYDPTDTFVVTAGEAA